MDSIRHFLEQRYVNNRKLLFKLNPDAEKAHHLAVSMAKGVNRLGLTNFLLSDSEVSQKCSVQFANAAGSNKEGTIPPQVLAAFGFDINIVGTVTAQPWRGNDKPRVVRDIAGQNILNKMGLPGSGANAVVRNLHRYGKSPIETRVSIMSTPGLSNINAQRDDIIRTISYFGMAYSFELNISCPNTSHPIKEQLQNAGLLIEYAKKTIGARPLYVKISPDMSRDDLRALVDISVQKGAQGFVTTNTTTNYEKYKFSSVPTTAMGGLSGNALYRSALYTQTVVADKISNAGYKSEIHACGGINSVERAKERAAIGNVTTIQLYTPLIYDPTLMRDLRKAFAR